MGSCEFTCWDFTGIFRNSGSREPACLDAKRKFPQLAVSQTRAKDMLTKFSMRAHSHACSAALRAVRAPVAAHALRYDRKRMPIHEKHFRDLGSGGLVPTWDLASLRGWICPEFTARWDLASLRVCIRSGISRSWRSHELARKHGDTIFRARPLTRPQRRATSSAGPCCAPRASLRPQTDAYT